MGKKSKEIGNRYERRVAKLLSQFTGKNFRKTPTSGGFNKTGGVKVAEFAFSGDIICDDPGFIFSVEVKNRKDMSLTALFKSPGSAMFTTCWHQCVSDAKNINKKPLMFFKPNSQDDWVCISLSDANIIGVSDRVEFLILNVYNSPISINKVGVVELPNPIIIDWNVLVKYANPSSFFSGGGASCVVADPNALMGCQ